MIVNGINPETGETIQINADEVNSDFIGRMSTFSMTDADVKRVIDNLDISADAKSLLYTFSRATLKAGEYIIKIGRKIIDFISRLIKEFPSATFGLIFGAIAGFLISTIPILGVVLGPLLTPILMAFGMLGGLKEDIKDKALERKISEINKQFTPLRT